MKEYDVIVIGAGTGLNFVFNALSSNMKVALIAGDYVGGTCLNVGCVPSKMLIYPADLLMNIQNARRLGITSEIVGIDFESIMARTRAYIDQNVYRLKENLNSEKNLDFYETEGQFVSDYTLRVNDENIRGKRIFIASGARPF
ncbi:MAG TPA: FAD-dependent oxidoreductase, partial [Syntrophorhabdaceae bacterium]|nr:FAD-dependent oxidoreductase [Syntrophorhabdaceae bacterium]